MKLRSKPATQDAELLKAEKELAALNRELAWELSKAAVDIAGLVDPTPISDGISMAMSLAEGDLVGAGLSLVSMVPFAGDALAKTTKGARGAQKILKLQKKIAAVAAKVRTLKSGKGAKTASKTVAKAAKKQAVAGPCINCQKQATKHTGSSRKLGRALARHGPRPPKHDAHHVVASTDKRAASARRVLQRFGIDFDDAGNGVFLPKGKAGKAPMTHGDLHTKTYFDAVNRALGKARTRSQALQILDNIKQQLLNGTFPR